MVKIKDVEFFFHNSKKNDFISNLFFNNGIIRRCNEFKALQTLAHFKLLHLIIIVLNLLVIFPQNIQSQIIFSHSSIYDQNIFRNYQQIPDWVHQTSIFLAKKMNIKSSQIRFSYSGDFNAFQNYNERQFFVHQLAMDSYLPIISKLGFYLSGNYVKRVNTSTANIYQYSNFLISYQLKWNKWQSLPFEIGSHFKQRNFSELEQLSYQENFAFLCVKHFLPTKTTFIGEINFAEKKYLNDQTIEQMIITDKETVDVGNGKGSGKGKGKGNWDSDNTTVIPDTTITAYNLSATRTKQWIISFKIAQSLLSKTGLSLQYRHRFKPKDNTRYLNGQEYSYTADDEIYDDPYSYGSNLYDLTITQILPWSIQLKLFSTFEDKRYTYFIDTYSEESTDKANENRKDDQTTLGISFLKKINFDNFIDSISIYISYYHIKNNSNDLYFDYSTNATFAGLEIGI